MIENLKAVKFFLVTTNHENSTPLIEPTHLVHLVSPFAPDHAAVFGCMLGCVGPVLAIAATMSYRSPFLASLDRKEAAGRARRAFADSQSDHLAIVKVLGRLDHEWE